MLKQRKLKTPNMNKLLKAYFDSEGDKDTINSPTNPKLIVRIVSQRALWQQVWPETIRYDAQKPQSRCLNIFVLELKLWKSSCLTRAVLFLIFSSVKTVLQHLQGGNDSRRDVLVWYWFFNKKETWHEMLSNTPFPPRVDIISVKIISFQVLA